MAILKIARMGHPVLRRTAASLAMPINEETRRLATDMIDTMLDAPGIGLAGPQVHEALRMIVYRIPADRATGAPGDTTFDTRVLINPVIEPVGNDQVTGWEGCLSIPGLRGLVPRWSRIRFHGIGLEGETVEGEATGTHARVIQHEVDHLDGILYLDRMPDLSKLTFTEEMRFFAAELATSGLPPPPSR